MDYRRAFNILLGMYSIVANVSVEEAEARVKAIISRVDKERGE